ncbi:short-chain dehydrogenase/reductase SDR [Tremella mesenterica]|uniref:Short-chain dehydrogenase/reductase SDR n=1 Tax=Tremella mesenterica TaxID=5217 RepID=A0A4Q1B9C2_TREME|nr:uncharacterized protein TREMEDRAFT_44064 [Tremella mesenterica DSM 1558]EIW69547.1 hypothetical protein TREMEDRAFT_44064 [Tremella mesenterica DSM 1558]RXK35292.1 short-chain dehydrogenase/reductase SDR [Tremella mesenterica]
MSRVVLITGASAGIGRASAVALSEAFPSPTHPEKLVLCLAGRREAELKATAEQCKEGTTIEVCVGSTASEEDVKGWFKTIKEKYGRLDVLFNNAGVDLLPGVPFIEADLTKFRDTLETNIMGGVICTQQAFLLMKDQSPQGGRIINNGSISASTPRPNSFPYTISKHGVLGLTKCISLDGRPYKISATQLDIGNAVTGMANHLSKGSKQADGSIRPEPLMAVKNVADTIVYLTGLGRDADVLRLEILAAGMPYVGRG